MTDLSFKYQASDRVSIEVNENSLGEMPIYDVTIMGVIDRDHQRLIQEQAQIIAHIDGGDQAFVTFEVESDRLDEALALLTDNNLGITAAEAQAALQQVVDFEGI
ncbi:hypothetical protein GC177_09455 [bacterium]|nr:hypothetical protein [bacterium]